MKVGDPSEEEKNTVSNDLSDLHAGRKDFFETYLMNTRTENRYKKSMVNIL